MGAQESSSVDDSSDSCSGSSCSESGSTMTLAQQESEWDGDEVSGYGSEGSVDSWDAAANVCDDGEYGSAWEACMNDLLGSVDEDLSGDFESEHVSNEYGSEWSDTSGSGSDAGSASGSGSDAGSDAEGSDAEGSEWSDTGSDASGAGSEGTFDSDSDLELAQHL